MRHTTLTRRIDATSTDARHGWRSFKHFFRAEESSGKESSENRKKSKNKTQWIPYDQAVTFARRLGFKSSAEWRSWSSEHREERIAAGVRAHPSQYEEYVSFAHFLGYGSLDESASARSEAAAAFGLSSQSSTRKGRKKFIPFADALKFVRSEFEREWSRNSQSIRNLR